MYSNLQSTDTEGHTTGNVPPQGEDMDSYLLHMIAALGQLDNDAATCLNENGALQDSDGAAGVPRLKKNETSDGLTKAQQADLCQIMTKFMDGTDQATVTAVVESLVTSITSENCLALLDALLRIGLAHMRDIRGKGKGRRDQFYWMVFALHTHFPDLIEHLLVSLIPELGCWRDCRTIAYLAKDSNPRLSNAMIAAHVDAIKKGDFLACKWAPRRQNPMSTAYAKMMFPGNYRACAKYRRWIVDHSSEKAGCVVVEALMSAKRWEEVAKVLSHLTAANHAKYKKAFFKHIEEEYSAYIQSCLSKDSTDSSATMNVTGLQVNGLIKQLVNNHDGYHYYGSCYCCHGVAISASSQERAVIDVQWMGIEEKLLAKMEQDSEIYKSLMALVVIDRSGSMGGGPDCAAVGIGIFTARVLAQYEMKHFGRTLFGDRVIRFADSAEVICLNIETYSRPSEYIADYFRQENTFECGYTTNLDAVHDKVIAITLKAMVVTGFNLAPMLLILTDMQYNDSQMRRGVHTRMTHEQLMAKKYADAGLVQGLTLVWNLRGNTHTSHAAHDCPGVQQIGGCNQSMIEMFCDGNKIAQATGKDAKAVDTWDTCKGAMANYDQVTEWLCAACASVGDLTAAMKLQLPYQTMVVEAFRANLGWTSPWHIEPDDDDDDDVENDDDDDDEVAHA